MYLRSDWFIQELRYLKFQVRIKMVKYIFKWGCVYYICNLFLFFFYLWIVIKDDEIFHILVHKIVYLNMTLEPFCFAWWLLGYFSVLKMYIWFSAVVRFWPGFYRRWTPYGLIKVVKRTSNGSWTSNIRHCVIFCSVTLIKTRKSKILIQHGCLKFLVYMKEFWILFVVWKAKYFWWLSFTKGCKGPSFNNFSNVALKSARIKTGLVARSGFMTVNPVKCYKQIKCSKVWFYYPYSCVLSKTEKKVLWYVIFLIWWFMV